ncbi:MAG: hypothetical protein ABL949_12185 [Fimbriimonadaceae bacterium]
MNALTGWRKFLAIAGSGVVGAIAGYRSVSFQDYDQAFFLDVEFISTYAWLYLAVGTGIGFLCAAFFTQWQRKWHVWFLAWGFTIFAVWISPSFFPLATAMSKSTVVAWAGTLAFNLSHFAWSRTGTHEPSASDARRKLL